MDQAVRVERNDIGTGKDFYTVSEAAKLLEVGQRRVLEMLETKEIEGERDPTSSRWKVSKHSIHELALEKMPGTKEPPLTEQETAKPRVAEETQEATEELPPARQPSREEDPTGKSSEHSAQKMWERVAELEHSNDRLRHEHLAEKAMWQEERGSLLADADRARQHVEVLQEEVVGLRAKLDISQERVEKVEGLNERLQLAQQREKVAWRQEKESLIAAANRSYQHIEALQKEVAKLASELEESWQLTGKLERLNDRLQQEHQTKEAAWREEKEALLAVLDRERQHTQRLQEEAEMLSVELESEQRRRSWRRLLGK